MGTVGEESENIRGYRVIMVVYQSEGIGHGEGLGKKFECSVSTGGLVVNGWLHFLY